MNDGALVSRTNNSRLVAYLQNASEQSGRSLTSVAAELGHAADRPLRAVMRGELRMPLDWVIPLANILALDRALLLALAMEQFSPELAAVIDGLRLDAAAKQAPAARD